MTSNLNKAHAKLSASGSDKWLNCPGSVAAESVIPNTTSPYADEGTLAHEIADRCLKRKCDAEKYFGKSLKELKIKLPSFKETETISRNMVENVQQYLDYVRSHETATTRLFTEQRVDFSNVVPEGFGTLDSGVLNFELRRIDIFDLKYGSGILVSAENNNQGKVYGVGLLNDLNFMGILESIDTVRIHIVQPRKNNFSFWDISVKDLVEFSKYLKERATLALSKDAPRIGGIKQCTWCRAKGDCAVAWKKAEEIIEFDELEDVQQFDVNNLTTEKKEEILENKKFIEGMLKAVWESLFTQMVAGEVKSDKFKLVASSPNRKLIDGAEAIIVKKLGDAAYNKKILGLGDLEKKLSKAEVAELTFKPAGVLAMAHMSDKRPEITDAEKYNFETTCDEFEDE